MGLVILWQFFTTLPDGKLRMTICNVGQGDSAYLRFPDGRDMLIDGGPGSQVLLCLGKVMPFWDRHLDAVVLTHPDADHFRGLVNVVKRYQVGVFVRSEVTNSSSEFKELEQILEELKIPVRRVAATELLKLGAVTVDVLWPAQPFLSQTNNVLSAQTDTSSVQAHRNDYSIVFHLRYGSFDAIFTGDADQRVDPYYRGEFLTADAIEFLKVPHHGSRTGMSDAFLEWVHPQYAAISVSAKNSYGHPSPDTLEQLRKVGSKVFRTDQNGSIFVETDGKTMKVWTER